MQTNDATITKKQSNIFLYKTKRFQVISTEAPYNNKIHHTKEKSIYLDINCNYTLQILKQKLEHYKISYILGPCDSSIMESTPPPNQTFQWREYERIDWNTPGGASSFKFRKGLSRKAQLCHYTSNYIYKYPNSILSKSIPITMIVQTWSLFETNDNNGLNSNTMDFKERVSLCLADVQRWMSDEEERYCNERKKKRYPIWILKPSSSNKGDGISIIHCLEEIQEAILDNTDIREWVVQKYISNPLLLTKRKFHVRAYILAVNTLQVYFYNHVLYLRSAIPYTHNPTSSTPSASYLSNTFQQKQNTSILDTTTIDKQCVLIQEQVYNILLKDKTCKTLHECKQRLNNIQIQMHKITNEIFNVYKNERNVFEPIEGHFEPYGFDFMVDDEWNVYLLEINPGPDFQQTGEECKGVICGFMEDTIDVALLGNRSGYGTDFTLVFDYGR